jgi:hypothetical protein
MVFGKSKSTTFNTIAAKTPSTLQDGQTLLKAQMMTMSMKSGSIGLATSMNSAILTTGRLTKTVKLIKKRIWKMRSTAMANGNTLSIDMV